MTPTIVQEEIPLRVDADGVIRVGNTRVMLDTVVYAFQDGATVEEIAQQYPALKIRDAYLAIGYYLSRRDEIDAYLREAEQQAERVKRENQARWNTRDLRERLLARQSARG